MINERGEKVRVGWEWGEGGGGGDREELSLT